MDNQQEQIRKQTKIKTYQTVDTNLITRHMSVTKSAALNVECSLVEKCLRDTYTYIFLATTATVRYTDDERRTCRALTALRARCPLQASWMVRAARDSWRTSSRRPHR